MFVFTFRWRISSICIKYEDETKIALHFAKCIGNKWYLSPWSSYFFDFPHIPVSLVVFFGFILLWKLFNNTNFCSLFYGPLFPFFFADWFPSILIDYSWIYNEYLQFIIDLHKFSWWSFSNLFSTFEKLRNIFIIKLGIEIYKLNIILFLVSYSSFRLSHKISRNTSNKKEQILWKLLIIWN